MTPESSSKALRNEIARLLTAAERKGESDYYGGKRSNTRVSDAVRLEVSLDPNQSSETWGVSMRDVSADGVAFWSKREVRMRAELFVREFSPEAPRPWIPGRVKHATVGIRGYLIGVAFMIRNDSSAAVAQAPKPDFGAAPRRFPPKFSVRRH
jgi:hypothetical protein